MNERRSIPAALLEMNISDAEFSLMESTLANFGLIKRYAFNYPIGETSPRSSTPLEGKRSRINPLSEIPSNHGPFQSALSLGVLNSPSKSMFPEATSSPVASPISSPTPQFWSTSPSKQNGSNHSRYKTEICRSYRESGHCKYGEKCQFAHGADELRTNNRHPKYKTERCRTFHSSGYCPYGPRCHFIHGEDDEKLSELRSNRSSRHPSGASVASLNQNQSAPTTPRPLIGSDGPLGLGAGPVDTTSTLASFLCGAGAPPPAPTPALGMDESSNESSLSFVDVDFPLESPAPQAPSSLATAWPPLLRNRLNSLAHAMATSATPQPPQPSQSQATASNGQHQPCPLLMSRQTPLQQQQQQQQAYPPLPQQPFRRLQ